MHTCGRGTPRRDNGSLNRISLKTQSGRRSFDSTSPLDQARSRMTAVDDWLLLAGSVANPMGTGRPRSAAVINLGPVR